ncbi:MAG TPA: prepilin-type N-terminal cleavage/methylation domain-containing protein [Fimbriimonadaceae bacterium]|nr:prepilin-type N-terminal cleavage/methylation domain-containing protein [Fimbriimonadaceae bacterium]
MRAVRLRRGFSLVESLMAVFLVAMCAMVVSATMPMANRSRLKADLSSKAVGMAQKQLEAVRGLGYANLTPSQLFARSMIDSTTPVASDTYSFTNVDSAALDNPARILPSGTGQLKVEQVDLDLRRVTVSVAWSENGNNRSFQIGTLVANL